jgi:uncharacterized protein with HEPN domain
VKGVACLPREENHSERLAANYFRINHEIVWETVDKHLTPLKEKV